MPSKYTSGWLFVSVGKSGDIPSNYLWTIVSDHYENLWIGTAGNGLVHFDPRNKVFTPIVNRENLNIENQSIYSIFCDDDNNLWIGTSTNGL
ncbi:MAG: two-component regulator propeller domain-containing protein, partial [Paludibacteraceae bacterium]